MSMPMMASLNIKMVKNEVLSAVVMIHKFLPFYVASKMSVSICMSSN